MNRSQLNVPTPETESTSYQRPTVVCCLSYEPTFLRPLDFNKDMYFVNVMLLNGHMFI